jgi:hypothetical protein
MKRKDLIKKLTDSGVFWLDMEAATTYTKIRPQEKSSLFQGIMK